MMNIVYLKWVGLIFICLQPGHAQDYIRYNSFHKETFCYLWDRPAELSCPRKEFIDITLVRIGSMTSYTYGEVQERCEQAASAENTDPTICLAQSSRMLHLLRGTCGLPTSSCLIADEALFKMMVDVHELSGEHCEKLDTNHIVYVEYGCLARIDNEFFEIGKDYPGSRSYDGSLFLLSPQYNDYDAATRTYSCDISFKATYATSTVTARQLFSLEVYEFQEDGFSWISFYESNECHKYLAISKTYLYSDTVDISICPHEHDKFNESELSFSDRSGEPTGYNIKYMFNNLTANPLGRFVIRISDGEASKEGSTDIDCGTPFVTTTPVTTLSRPASLSRPTPIAITTKENTIAPTENTTSTENVTTKPTAWPTPTRQSHFLDSTLPDADPMMLYILTLGSAGLAIGLLIFGAIFSVTAYRHRKDRQDQPHLMEGQDSISLAYTNNNNRLTCQPARSQQLPHPPRHL